MSKTTLERTSDREVVITRTFRAPAAIVFDAKPEYVSLWWAPRSRRVTVAECQAEVRVGGGYRYVIARSETSASSSTGSTSRSPVPLGWSIPRPSSRSRMQLWAARFDELDIVVEEMKRKEKANGSR